jgi:hypothetical protein
MDLGLKGLPWRAALAGCPIRKTVRVLLDKEPKKVLKEMHFHSEGNVS